MHVAAAREVGTLSHAHAAFLLAVQTALTKDDKAPAQALRDVVRPPFYL